MKLQPLTQPSLLHSRRCPLPQGERARDATPIRDDAEELRCISCFAAGLSPLRNFALKSATAAIVSLVSGRSTGSLRSAERSAAV